MKKLILFFLVFFVFIGFSFSQDSMFFSVSIWGDANKIERNENGCLYPKVEIIVPIDEIFIIRAGVSFYEDFFLGGEIQAKKDIIKNFCYFAAGGGAEFNFDEKKVIANFCFSFLIKISENIFIDTSMKWSFDKKYYFGCGLWF